MSRVDLYAIPNYQQLLMLHNSNIAFEYLGAKITDQKKYAVIKITPSNSDELGKTIEFFKYNNIFYSEMPPEYEYIPLIEFLPSESSISSNNANNTMVLKTSPVYATDKDMETYISCETTSSADSGSSCIAVTFHRIYMPLNTKLFFNYYAQRAYNSSAYIEIYDANGSLIYSNYFPAYMTTGSDTININSKERQLLKLKMRSSTWQSGTVGGTSRLRIFEIAIT